MTTSKEVWVLGEYSEGQVDDISLELVSKGRSLGDELKGEVCVAVVGTSNSALADTLAHHGADKVYFLNSPLLSEYSAERYTEALSGFFKEKDPDILLCGATLIGRDLAPRLAARLRTGLVSNCISLGLDVEGHLLQTKLTHGGKVSTSIITPHSRPQMATVRTGIMEKAKPNAGRKPEIIESSVQIAQRESRIRVTKSFIKGDPEKIGLDEADGIVAGGRGMANADSFQLLRELAKSLGMVVAGSLPAIDEGWLPRNKQVGQTGMTVTPDLYIACGISGSNYHILGMKDSKVIMAINKDRNAPIFKVADMSIVGDVLEVIPAVIDRLRETPHTAGKSDTKGNNAREI